MATGLLVRLRGAHLRLLLVVGILILIRLTGCEFLRDLLLLRHRERGDTLVTAGCQYGIDGHGRADHLLCVVHDGSDSSGASLEDTCGHSLSLLAVDLWREDLHDLSLMRRMNLPGSVCINDSRVIGIRQSLGVHCLNSLTSTALRAATTHPIVDQYGVSALAHLISSHLHLFHSLIGLLLIGT